MSAGKIGLVNARGEYVVGSSSPPDGAILHFCERDWGSAVLQSPANQSAAGGGDAKPGCPPVPDANPLGRSRGVRANVGPLIARKRRSS